MSLAAQIDRGVAIVAQMAALKKELEEIEEAVRAHARAHPEAHVALGDAEREGRQFLAAGEEFTVKVLFTADKIVGSFAYGSDRHEQIAEMARGHFASFFKPVWGYENWVGDGKKFRELADELLGAAAPAFVTACKAVDKLGIPKQDVKIEWQEAMAARKKEELAEDGHEKAQETQKGSEAGS